jgi:hypothetical protein
MVNWQSPGSNKAGINSNISFGFATILQAKVQTSCSSPTNQSIVVIIVFGWVNPKES